MEEPALSELRCLSVISFVFVFDIAGWAKGTGYGHQAKSLLHLSTEVPFRESGTRTNLQKRRLLNKICMCVSK